MSPDAVHPARHRYGEVLFLSVVVLVFVIATPETTWSRAITLALQTATLLVVAATSHARAEVRRFRALAVSALGILLVAGAISDVLPVVHVLAGSAVLSALTPAALVGGLVRLLRERGVTAQAVAGALAIYVMIGLLFGSVAGVLARAIPGPFFAQGTDGTVSDRVYFSFETMTTTGFGDFTPGQPSGRALAVVAMLTGQIYLVTVIGILVGILASRPRSSS